MIQYLELAAVSVRSDMGKEKQIVAYVVCKNHVTKDHILAYLESYLPHYMIPNHIVFLDKMPKSNSDKIDYKKLPKPQYKIQNQQNNEHAGKPKEIILALLADIAGNQVNDMNTTLKQLGFNSLSLVRLMISIKSEFGVHLAAHDINYGLSISQLISLIQNSIEA